MRSRFVLVLLAVALVAGALQQTRASTPVGRGLTGPLHTAGNKVLDTANRAVRLRGVNRELIDAYSDFGAGPHLDDRYWALVRSSNANVVRLPLGEQFWNAFECAYDVTYAPNVDAIVRAITSRHMLAILDLHHNTTFPCAASGQQRMGTDGQGVPGLGSLSFWKSVATRYRDNPLVAFDLYNEPHDVTPTQWRDGGLTQGTSLPYDIAGMQEMYAAVRGTGATNLVFVSGLDYAGAPPPTGSLLDGTNIVYAAHSYVCSSFVGAGCATEPKVTPDPTKQLSQWDALARQRPVIVSEFGWPWGRTGAFDATVIRWAEAHAVGWIAYQMTPNAPTQNDPFGFLTSWTSLAPTPRGRVVLQGLAANR